MVFIFIFVCPIASANQTALFFKKQYINSSQACPFWDSQKVGGAKKLPLSKIYCTSSNDVKFGEKVGLRNAKLVHQAPRILVTSGFFQQ